MQTRMLTVSEVESLLAAMKKHGKEAQVDWVNQNIQVLSDPITHPTVKVSDGPLVYQDRLFYLGK